MNSFETLQQLYLEEIKDIATKLSKVQSASGLMMHQQEVQKLYERFIFLKETHSFSTTSKELNESVQTAISESSEKPQIEETATVLETPIMFEKEVEKVAEVAEQKEVVKSGGMDFNFSINESKKYNKLQIDVNDNIGFLNILFAGNKEEYNKFMETLNDRNLESSKDLITHYKKLLDWTANDEEYVERLSELNLNRFQ